jgi:hypothetical protein
MNVNLLLIVSKAALILHLVKLVNYPLTSLATVHSQQTVSIRADISKITNDLT